MTKILNSILFLLILSSHIYAQKPADTFWHLGPNSKKGNSGIGLYEAQQLVKSKTPNTIVVAIIDAGVDIHHPDLKSMLWTNSGEIPENGIDDDSNGYVDDVYGWNFIGEITFDNMELTRQYAKLNEKYELKDSDIKDQEEYNKYLNLKELYLKENLEAKFYFEFFEKVKQGLEFLENDYGSDITLEEVQNHKSKSKYDQMAKRVLLSDAKTNKSFDYLASKDELIDAYNHFDFQFNYGFNADFNPTKQKEGNNNVYYGERFSDHGTHVAGIVAADAGNDFGAKGICQSCKIMSLRVVPEGDERDIDVANSIRYAVDNGAQIVNMSFGKSYVNNAEIVKKAIRYAQDNNVLLIHAAGNDGKNNDNSENYPNDSKDEFNNWLEIGASNWEKKPNALATFSNYGLKEVDLFAPGVSIYSTTPENQYLAQDGTSMASPVVSGVAAFVLSYYPELQASELKQILIDSSIPIKGRNKIPGAKKKTRVCKISKSGGQVNLPAALKLAAEMQSK